MSLVEVHIHVDGWYRPWMTSKPAISIPQYYRPGLVGRGVAEDSVAPAPKWDILQLEA